MDLIKEIYIAENDIQTATSIVVVKSFRNDEKT